MIKKILLVLPAIVLPLISGCNNSTKISREEKISRAYDKYHPTYGYRNSLPDKEYEVSSDKEALWQRPPERVTVYRTPDGPETGPHGRAAITGDYVGYEAKDIPVLQQELGAGTENLTTRQPVKELPDYLQGNYGSSANSDKVF